MLKLFISYNHVNRADVDRFMKHVDTLCQKKVIDVWFDGNLKSGYDIWDNIDTHLTRSDITCIFLSADYLASTSCMKEMRAAINLYKKDGMMVIPIVVSPCSWLDYEDLSHLLAATPNGKPVSQYQDNEQAWLDIYEVLKKSIDVYNEVKQLKFTSEILKFIDDVDILSKTHSQKDCLCLDDVLVYPEMEVVLPGKSAIVEDLERVIADFRIGNRMECVGDEQSGKTTVAKLLMRSLRKRGFIPVYISSNQDSMKGNLNLQIENTFIKQYESAKSLSSYPKELVIPIVDDFYKAKKVDAFLSVLADYKSSVIIVDDIFDMDPKYEPMTCDYIKCKIMPLKASKRVKLIRKWMHISEKHIPHREIPNEEYAIMDNLKVMIDYQLENGMMPAYPFFILFMLSSYETNMKPLDSEITTQGYCYQSLIYLFLRKQGVSNDSIDSYLNFLTEFAFAVYKNNGSLEEKLYNQFLQYYREEFSMADNESTVLSRLLACDILSVTSARYYDFTYPYLYYFFAGKYFAEHSDYRDEANDEALVIIQDIFDNLHKNSNAYIAVFIAHHTKDKYILKRIEDVANKLFIKYEMATLNAKELSFFKQNVIESITLPAENNNPEEQRQQALAIEDEKEKMQRKQEENADEVTDELSRQLRSSIKTVEVLGQIMRNRAGSLKISDTKRLCQE